MMDGLQGSGHAPDAASFTWDEFCDLLDGLSWEAFASRRSSREHSQGGDDALRLREQLFSCRQYFFETNRVKRTMEIFWLKLCLAERLCSLVSEQHERLHRAYGVLDPGKIVIEIPTGGATILPIRWAASLSVRDGGPSEGVQFADMPEEMARGLTPMPEAVDFAYAVPLMRQWPLGRELPVTALIQSADPIPDDENHQIQGLVRVHVIADEIDARDFSDRDVFRVMLPLGSGRGAEVCMWARKVDSPERGIIVSGMTDAVSIDTWKTFARDIGQARSAAKVAVYRSCLPAHDVYSCGMLLLRALLGADEGRWTRVRERFPSLLEGLSPLVQGIEEGDHYTVHLRVKDRLNEWNPVFAPADVPEDLWWDALVAVLRACSRIQGFSYGHDAHSYERSPMRDFARDLTSLSRRARTELFEARERDAMIARVCDRTVAQLGAGV